jgi:Fe2+ transport system protein FeoA
MSFNRQDPKSAAGTADAERNLLDIPLHQPVELVHLDVASDEVPPLVERGILPGCLLQKVRFGPGGDPIIRVDGGLIAMRREVARSLRVRIPAPQT